MDEINNDAAILRNVGALVALMRRLRDPVSGCPWDKQQTFASISPYTVEEAYEVADAIERESWPDLEDELGDLLLQVVFHAQIGAERGLFDLASVARAIVDKLHRRHPHLFAPSTPASAETQRLTWEEIKAAERAKKTPAGGEEAGALDGVAHALPPMQRAMKLQQRAARVGFDWPHAIQVWRKLQEEMAEVEELLDRPAGHEALQDEIGDLLFTIVNLARHLDIEPDAALRHANGKFERRFRGIEERARSLGKSPKTMALDDLEQLWQEVKADE